MKNPRRAFLSAAAVVWCEGRWAVGLAVVCVLFAVPAWGAPILPAPQSLAHCDVGGGNVLDDPTSCALGSFDTAFASLTLTPFVSLVAQAAAPAALGVHGAGANASVSYSFQVIGGNPGDVVPILIATTLITIGTDPTLGIGFAALTVNTSAVGTKTLMAVCTDGTCGTTANSFSGTLNTVAKSGDVDELFLQVQASVVGNSLHSESASASADPFIFVDPAFSNASLYSIVVSPGVGNAGALAVPEPGGIWPMLAVGLAAIGFTRVRRRRSAD